MYVHVPIYPPARFLQESKNGRYGAAVQAIDWSVGVLLYELKQLGLDDNTLVIFHPVQPFMDQITHLH